MSLPHDKSDGSTVASDDDPNLGRGDEMELPDLIRREPSPSAEEGEVCHSEPDPYPDFDFGQLRAMLAPTPGEKPAALPTINTSMSAKKREEFVASLSPDIQDVLNTPYGKPNPNVAFTCVPELRQVLLPLWWSGFLTQDEENVDWKNLASVSAPARNLLTLARKYGDVDVNSLPGYKVDWNTPTTIQASRTAQMTAALFLFRGNIPSLFQWLGGPYTAAHRNPAAILRFVQPILDPALHKDLQRIYLQGSPAKCNGEETEQNYRLYKKYGNHKSVDMAPAKVEKALVKDINRGYAVAFDPLIVDLLPHVHLTPMGIVTLDDEYKKARNVFDSSFRPSVTAQAINDWTHKDNAPSLTFATSFIRFLTWIYNLRIDYPDEEIMLGEDDVASAFRHILYNAAVIGMHCCLILNCL